MPRQYRKYSDSEIIKYAADSSGMSDLLRKLGLKVAGGNFNHMRKTIQRLNICCDHWNPKKNQAWNKDKRLKDWSDYARASNLKPHLIKERGHCCQNCGLNKWLDKDIPLEIEHIDGDRTNNDENNLKLLCCNCHAFTSTWRGKKNKK